MATATSRLPSPGPITAITINASRNSGKAMMISMALDNTPSPSCLMTPASAPITSPHSRAIAVAPKPMASGEPRSVQHARKHVASGLVCAERMREVG